MDVDPYIQTIEVNGMAKEEEVDELLADVDEMSDFEEDENDDPNEFRIREPLPVYREYKRKLLEVHSMCASFLCSDTHSNGVLFRNGSFK